MISKEEASCVFYCKEFNEENDKTCIQNIQLSPDVDLCYIVDPKDPLLVCKTRIYGSRVYKLYKSKKVSEAVNSDKKEDLILGKDSQIVEFLNYIYRPPEEDLFDSRYRPALVSDQDILSTVLNFTTKFDKKGSLGFSQWLSHQKLDLTAVVPQRKSLKTGNEISSRIRKRKLNVLNDTYFLSVAENVLDILPNHHLKINAMKKDGYKIIGYCRKSVAETGDRVSCLQSTVNVLYSRSLVDKVFVSPCSSTKQQFAKRDSSDTEQILSQLNNIHGDTVDFLNFLKNNIKICVVSIGYAGLTTNVSDLKKLLSENPSLKKVVIDQYFYENFKCFNSDQLLNNPMDLKAFNCRPKTKINIKA